MATNFIEISKILHSKIKDQDDYIHRLINDVKILQDIVHGIQNVNIPALEAEIKDVNDANYRENFVSVFKFKEQDQIIKFLGAAIKKSEEQS